MGLDMYLVAREYLADYDWYPEAIRNKYKAIVKTTDENSLQYEENKSIVVEYQAMYWRKANAIHGWFVDNVQDGVDDCSPHTVLIEDLEELVKTCKEVLDDRSKAPELLPPRAGFFFGPDSYDDWYFDNIKITVERLTKLIDIGNRDNIAFQYVSSW